MQSGATSTRTGGRAVWLKTLHQWHWISSAFSLLGMLLFSITGLTLNHAAQIESKPVITHQHMAVPAPLQRELRQFAAAHDGATLALPSHVQRWLQATWSVASNERSADWSQEEVVLTLPKAGGDAWVRFALPEGTAEYEVTDRGWISWFNDVHKGRNTGAAWGWFIDLFALSCLVFCITGFLILKFHAANRPAIWPVVGLGVLIPCLLALLFIH